MIRRGAPRERSDTQPLAVDGQEPIVVLTDVRKTYGSVVALESFSLTLGRGSLLCLVGPNGAGKTTAVECLEGLRRPDSGEVRVFGLDPAVDRHRIYERVGVQLQEATLHERLKVCELVGLFASFYANPADGSELLDLLALSSKRSSAYGDLSGGQKRRLHILLALIGNPELVILDEPTSGLDPQARRNIWMTLKEARSRGTAVIVTTHYLEEAEDHAHRVMVIDSGRVIVDDHPRSMLSDRGLGVRVSIPAGRGVDIERIRAVDCVMRVEVLEDEVLVYGRDDNVRTALRSIVGDKETGVRRARLEDLFLMLTGREYRDA